MKTLKNLRNKKRLLVTAFMLSGFCAVAQSSVLPKTKKLQAGLFAEFQKEFESDPIWDNENNFGVTAGASLRYRLSPTFCIASGPGISLARYTYSADPLHYGRYEPLTDEKEAGKSTQYIIRLPIVLQTNLYRQKIFVSSA